MLCGSSVETRVLGVVCQTCWDGSSFISGGDTICWKCGVPGQGVIGSELREQVRCRKCDDQPYSAARAVGTYDGALRASVLTLKRQPHLSRQLITALSEVAFQVPLSSATRIVPVPLHAQRERQRGFNQATVIARELSKTLSLPVDEVSLTRVRSSEKYRAGLDAKGRQDTVENAFVVVHERLVAGENIMLVDDVFTTGATASSCARVLIEAGAENVFVLTIARTV